MPYGNATYFLDDQKFLFDRFMETARGGALYEYRAASFIVCVLFLLASLAVCWKAKPEPGATGPGQREKFPKFIFICSALVLAGLFFIHPLIAFDYMDFSYLFEGKFNSASEFFIKREYFCNMHVPGYLLLSWAAQAITGLQRYPFILINCAVVLLAVVPFYRLCRLNMSPAASACATLAMLIAPINLFCLYRVSPYTMVSAAFILAAYCYHGYKNTGGKRFLTGGALLVFALPFLHILSFWGVAAFLAGVFVEGWRNGFREKRGRFIFAAMALSAAGSLIYNFSYVVAFPEVYEITKQTTARLQVYFNMPGGNREFIPFCVKMILNLYLSFLSINTAVAIVSGLLLATGCALLALRGKHGFVFAALSLAGGLTLLLTNVLNYSRLSGYPMSYRHLAMLSPFFIYAVFVGAEKMAAPLKKGSIAVVLALFGVYAFHLPGTISALRAPDMTSALAAIYGDVREYDGIIPGNMFFLSEYGYYFFRNGKSGYGESRKFIASERTRYDGYMADNTWSAVRKPSGETVGNVMLNIAPFHIDSHSTILKNNFLKRVWYVDNETKVFGVFPDFSPYYSNDIQEGLKGARLVSGKKFRGVTLKLYELDHPLSMWDKGRLEIFPGKNDYYYIRGTNPGALVKSATRGVTGETEICAMVPESANAVRIRLSFSRGAKFKPGRIIDLNTGKSFLPEDGSSNNPEFVMPVCVGADRIHAGLSGMEGELTSAILELKDGARDTKCAGR